MLGNPWDCGSLRTHQGTEPIPKHTYHEGVSIQLEPCADVQIADSNKPVSGRKPMFNTHLEVEFGGFEGDGK